MRHDLLSDVMNIMKNADKLGKKFCTVPASNLIKEVLKVIQKEGYIGSFEFIDDGKSGKINIELLGKINNSKAIKPRFSVKKDEFEKWERRYLPSRDMGLLIVSTPKGLMTHTEAIKRGLGGKLVAYIY
jgi:small subunit ribosomal protein S8